MIEYTVKVQSGITQWFLDGLLHREGGPAIEYGDGATAWYKHGLTHRDDDLPAIEYANGNKMWYKNGLLHREGGPAIEYANGIKMWYKNGLLHREGGPAIENEWWENGYIVKRRGASIKLNINIIEIAGVKYEMELREVK